MHIFNKFPDNPHTFLVQHITGYSEEGMEPVKYREILFSSDEKQECVEYIQSITPVKRTGWEYDNYIVVTNITTTMGAQIYSLWSDQVAERTAWAAMHPERFHTIETGGITLHLEKNEMFDQVNGLTKEVQPLIDLHSYGMIFLDTKD